MCQTTSSLSKSSWKTHFSWLPEHESDSSQRVQKAHQPLEAIERMNLLSSTVLVIFRAEMSKSPGNLQMLHILCIPFLFTPLSFPRQVFKDLGQVHSINLSRPEGTGNNVINSQSKQKHYQNWQCCLSVHFPASGCIYSDTFTPQYGMEVAIRNISVLGKHQCEATYSYTGSHAFVLFLSILLRQFWPVTVSSLQDNAQSQGPFSTGYPKLEARELGQRWQWQCALANIFIRLGITQNSLVVELKCYLNYH